MLANQGYAAYANNKIMTASPAELTLMLYEGAIKFANLAIEAIDANDIQKAHNNIMKVQRIIEEFQSTLDHKYPVAKDFDEVYNYLLMRLREANIKKDKDIMEEKQRCVGYSRLTGAANGEESISYNHDPEPEEKKCGSGCGY